MSVENILACNNKERKLMGLFNSLFSKDQCIYCDSYDTDRFDFHDLPESKQEEYYDKYGDAVECCYICRRCKTVNIKGQYEKKILYWEHGIPGWNV